MKNLKEYNTFVTEFVTEKEVKDVPEKYTIATTLKKSEWYKELRTRKEKETAQKISGTHVEKDELELTKDGFRYIVKTGDPDVPTLEIPKRFLYTY